MIKTIPKIHQHIYLELFWTVFAYKQCLICAYFSPDSDRVTFSLERAILNILMMDLFLANMQLLILQDVNWWTGLVWITCDVFISCVDSHSDGTHSLQRIHWWASDVILDFNKTVPMKKNSSTSWMPWGWVNSQRTFCSAHNNFGGELLLQCFKFP